MKTLSEILKQQPVFLHDWTEKIDVISDFENLYMTAEEYRAEVAPYAASDYWLEKKVKMDKYIQVWKDVNILFASYNRVTYSGNAFVLFEIDGELFEINASCCYYFGLEEQFLPKVTTLESLAHRLTSEKLGHNDYSGNEFSDQLKTFIGI